MRKKVIDEYVTYVKKYIKERQSDGFVKEVLLNICGGIEGFLLNWTGYTYVGVRKDKELEQTCQKFFVTVHKLLDFCDSKAGELTEMEKDLAKKMMYRGIVYRYIGKADIRNYRKKEVVNPEYNDIYVSWSKTEKNSYIESKLCGPVTWMKAEIKAPYYGIDIHGFELWCQEWLGKSSFITRGEEREVVFPTIEGCLMEVIHMMNGKMID